MLKFRKNKIKIFDTLTLISDMVTLKINKSSKNIFEITDIKSVSKYVTLILILDFQQIYKIVNF